MKKIVLFFQLSFIFAFCETTPSVVIIGSGPAGIATATRLLEKNFTDFIILEAENRFGGRIRSVHFGDEYLDLGAQWCHGQEGNVVYELTKDLGILVEDNMPSTILRASYGEKLNEELANGLMAIYEDVMAKSNGLGEEGVSLGEFFHKNYRDNITDLLKSTNTNSSLSGAIEELLDRLIVSSDGAFSINDPSSHYDFHECPGNQILTWNGKGYATIFHILMKTHPQTAPNEPPEPICKYLRLNTKVEKIRWNSSNPILELSDGSSMVVETVVFTPSIGVLKAVHGDIFEPKLPEEKISAIETIGFDGVMKFAVRFERNWWNENGDFKGVFLMWEDEEKRKVTEEFTEGPKEDGYSWITRVFALLSAPGNNPNVLMGWFIGPLLEEVEKLPLETFTKGFTVLLERFFSKKYNTTAPIEILRSDWRSNPNFRGTWSYQTIASRKLGTSPEELLAKPLKYKGKSVVLFAGESTHPTHYSTVHGAIETGFREAERILSKGSIVARLG